MTLADDPIGSLCGGFPHALSMAASDGRKADRLATRLPGASSLSLALLFSGGVARTDIDTSERPVKESKFPMSLQNCENRHWREAFDRFADLAEHGHGEAARMAWQMWRYGPELFGIEFPVDADRRQRWLAAWRGTWAKAEV